MSDTTENEPKKSITQLLGERLEKACQALQNGEISREEYADLRERMLNNLKDLFQRDFPQSIDLYIGEGEKGYCSFEEKIKEEGASCPFPRMGEGTSIKRDAAIERLKKMVNDIKKENGGETL